jgi:hypothetical protein
MQILCNYGRGGGGLKPCEGEKGEEGEGNAKPKGRERGERQQEDVHQNMVGI